MFLLTTLNIYITELFCELHSMLPTAAILKGPPAAILEISVASEQRRGKLCHLISIESTYFVRQLSVFIFVSVTPLYSSGGPFNMAAVGFSFPRIKMLNPVLFLRTVFQFSNVNCCMWTNSYDTELKFL